MELIKKHQEIKGIRKPTIPGVNVAIDECAVLSANGEYIKKTIEQSDIYNRIDKSADTVPYLHEVSLTNHLQKKPFSHEIHKAKSIGKQGSSDKPLVEKQDERKMRIMRLLDGLTVIEDDCTPTMLIDCKSSLLHTLAGQRYVVLREYDVTKAEQEVEQDEILGIRPA
jgi:hypothetical protein